VEIPRIGGIQSGQITGFEFGKAIGGLENEGQFDPPKQEIENEPATTIATETINIIASNVTIEQPDLSGQNNSCPDVESEEDDSEYSEIYVDGYIWIGKGTGKNKDRDHWQEPGKFLSTLKKSYQRKSIQLEKHREILKKHVQKGKAFFISKSTGQFIEDNKEIVGEEVYNTYLKFKPEGLMKVK
jgi:hypothetical protein